MIISEKKKEMLMIITHLMVLLIEFSRRIAAAMKCHHGNSFQEDAYQDYRNI